MAEQQTFGMTAGQGRCRYLLAPLTSSVMQRLKKFSFFLNIKKKKRNSASKSGR
jgi:hypothetical protein